ncbi:DUF5993 family protein [Silvanigrella sp.]|jgi:hypothetical protein|uniref:DUF5993 family protein n=1 Tax=Silvanigrella sp. TaxID=2024976 RepID=UPI0037CC05C0
MMALIFLVFLLSIIFTLYNKEKVAIYFLFIGIVLILFLLKYYMTDHLNLVF